MPWQRGHTLSIFSALCLSQRNQGSSGALTQLALPPTSALPPPFFSALLLPDCHTLTPAFAVPYRASLAMSLSSSSSHSLYFTLCLPQSSHRLTPFVSRWDVPMRWLTGTQNHKYICLYGHLSGFVHVSTKKDQKEESRSAAASEKSISV